MFDLTREETKVALLLVRGCLQAMGGKRPADLENDEFTWVMPQDLVKAGYTRFQAAGFFSSLSQKGIIAGEFGTKIGDVCETYLTTEAWRFLDTVWENKQAA